MKEEKKEEKVESGKVERTPEELFEELQKQRRQYTVELDAATAVIFENILRNAYAAIKQQNPKALPLAPEDAIRMMIMDYIKRNAGTMAIC